jgi:hypothetical protein
MPTSVQFHIPKPCHENWQNMTPAAQGRFCGSCQKTVIDFSAMSDKELLDHISNAAGQNTCGRFSNDQLNKEIIATENTRPFSRAYVWNVLLATFLVTESYAQGEPQISKKPEVQLPDLSPKMAAFAVKQPDTLPSVREVWGTIIHSNNKEPLSNAYVRVKGSSILVQADTAGRFWLKVENKDTITLEVSYVGYETQTVILDNKRSWQNVNVLMPEGELVVMGMMVVAYRPSLTRKVKRFFTKNLIAPLKREVKIKSDTVVRGNDLQIDVLLKAGIYQLELLDATSQVVTVQELVMSGKKREVIIPTRADWRAGDYQMRIWAHNGGNVYESKLAVK